MRGDPTLENFLGLWLTVRIREEAAAKLALSLHESLPTLIQGEMPDRFRDALTGRIRHLQGLLERIDQDSNNPPTAPGSVRGQWLRNARRLLTRWDQSAWSTAALELSGEKNPLMLAAVGQSLEAAVEPGKVARPVIDSLRKLRALDDRAVRTIPLPPGPHAPWNPSAYVFPTLSLQIVKLLDQRSIDAIIANLAGSVASAPAKALAEVLSLIEAGWPVPISRLVGPIQQLANLLPTGDSLLGSLEECLRILSFGEGTPSPTTARSIDSSGLVLDQVRSRAGTQLDELARTLLAETPAEAREFGRRLEEMCALPGTSTASGLHQELVGCLAALDEPGSPGASGRWRRSALERLAAISQNLGGGEILDEQLLGKPLGQWTEFVSVVGNDSQAPPGEPRRITRVARLGYRILFSNGEFRPLVRARVWIAL